jgi:hypothetical protein
MYLIHNDNLISVCRSGGEVRYLGRPEQDYFGAAPPPPPPATPALGRAAAAPLRRLREGVGGTRYSFLPPDSCSQEEEEGEGMGEGDSLSLSQFSREICRDLR